MCADGSGAGIVLYGITSSAVFETLRLDDEGREKWGEGGRWIGTSDEYLLAVAGCSDTGPSRWTDYTARASQIHSPQLPTAAKLDGCTGPEQARRILLDDATSRGVWARRHPRTCWIKGQDRLRDWHLMRWTVVRISQYPIYAINRFTKCDSQLLERWSLPCPGRSLIYEMPMSSRQLAFGLTC